MPLESCVALLLALAQGSEPARAALFVEDPSALPDVRTTCGSRAKEYILEVNGGGVVLADFDGDLDPDLVLVDGSTLARAQAGEPGFPPRLFLNDGAGRFEPAGEAWAMSGGRWGMGGAAGDVNGDGFLDLVVTQWGPTRLFLNRSGRGFVEAADGAGGAGGAGFAGSRWGTSAAFLDFDRDRQLDLAVVNYLAFDPERVPPPGGGCTWKGHPVMCGPEGLTPVHDQLYRGKGDGTFADVTLAAKFRPSEAGFGLGATTLDYDGDGDTDLYVANDSTPNHLWENQGDGTFLEVGFRRGVSHDANGRELASMGIGCGDVDGDGREDLLVTTFSGESNAFFQSRAKDAFRERASVSGLGGPSLPYLGWGTGLADLDLDGDLDAFVFNGHVYPQADEPGTDTSYAQVDHLWRNEGAGRFRPETLSDGVPHVSRASSFADLDGDGDLDLVALQLGGPVRLLRNTTLPRPGESRVGEGAAPHWLRVQLRARGGNRFALGARLRAEWEGGARTSEIRTAGGFQSSVPPEVHFGLGSTSRVQRLAIRWPSGREQVLEDVAADRLLVIEEPEK